MTSDWLLIMFGQMSFLQVWFCTHFLCAGMKPYGWTTTHYLQQQINHFFFFSMCCLSKQHSIGVSMQIRNDITQMLRKYNILRSSDLKKTKQTKQKQNIWCNSCAQVQLGIQKSFIFNKNGTFLQDFFLSISHSQCSGNNFVLKTDHSF